MLQQQQQEVDEIIQAVSTMLDVYKKTQAMRSWMRFSGACKGVLAGLLCIAMIASDLLTAMAEGEDAHVDTTFGLPPMVMTIASLGLAVYSISYLVQESRKQEKNTLGEEKNAKKTVRRLINTGRAKDTQAKSQLLHAVYHSGAGSMLQQQVVDLTWRKYQAKMTGRYLFLAVVGYHFCMSLGNLMAVAWRDDNQGRLLDEFLELMGGVQYYAIYTAALFVLATGIRLTCRGVEGRLQQKIEPLSRELAKIREKPMATISSTENFLAKIGRSGLTPQQFKNALAL